MLKKKFLTFYYNFLLPSCNSIGFILQRRDNSILQVYFLERSKTSGVAHGDSDLGSYFSGLCIPLFRNSSVYALLYAEELPDKLQTLISRFFFFFQTCQKVRT